MAANPSLLFPGGYAGPAPAAIPARERVVAHPLLRVAWYVYVFSIFFEMPERSIPLEVPTLTGAVFLLVTLFNFRVCYRRIPAPLFWFGMWLWFFGLSTLLNRGDHFGQVIALFVTFVQLVMLMWAGGNVMRDPRAFKGALLTFAIAAFLRAGLQVLGIGATYHQEWSGGFRTTLLGQNPNHSAILMAAGMVAVLNLRVRAAAWLMAGVIGVALIQTGSRGGLMCAVMGTLVLLWHGRTKWARVRALFMGMVVLGALVFAVYRSPMLSARFEEVVTEHSLAGREDIYPAVVSMISERPVLGWGPVENQYEIAVRINEKRQESRDAHNLVLELLSSTGFLGAIPFLIALALCVREAWRARRSRWQLLPIALCAAVLTGSISGTWIAAKVLWFVLAVALAAGTYVTGKTPHQEARA